ncbi:MAG: hypothetical protein HEQ19_21780 [Gloeotrichia echinulata CP02]|jgi:hypothetical protein
MTKLATEYLLYLLYTLAYSEEGTVTQGIVKKHLSKEQQKNADKICEALCKKKLLESPKRSRLSITEEGKKVLVTNLQTSDYKFNSSKGQKVLNTLLYCLTLTSFQDYTSAMLADDMKFETFVEKFKELYIEEKNKQELRGVVAIRGQDICSQLKETNAISQSLLDKYFARLKTEGKIFAVTEKDDELIQWVE